MHLIDLLILGLAPRRECRVSNEEGSLMSVETDNETYDVPLTNAAGAIHDGFQFLKVVWYHKNSMIMVGFILAIIAGWYAVTATRYYQSSASILIVQNGISQQDSTLGINRNSQHLMPTHQQLIVSQPVLENAIQYISSECLSEFKGQQRESWHRQLA